MYFGFWSHSWVNYPDQLPCLSNSTAEFQCVFKSIIGCTTTRTLAFWQSTNSFWRPGVSIINPASILCYVKINSRTFKYHEIRNFSIFFHKPGFMADTILILGLPSSRSPWLLPMSMLPFIPNCWSCSWASQDLLRPFTPRLLMNAPKASCMTCAIHGMWFLNAGHLIAEASTVDCSSRVIE